MARPTKYTPETVQKITQAIELGATYELACNYAGISYETFRKWMVSKVAFFEAVKAAEGKGATKWLAKIEQAASEGAWQAAAWKLERRYPQSYGKTVHEHRGKDGGPIKHDHTHRDLSMFSDDEIERLAAIAEERQAGVR